MNYLLLIVAAAMLACCRNPNEHIIIVSPQDVEPVVVTSELLNLHPAPIHPQGCLVVDSLLLVYDPHSPMGFLSIYSLKNFQRIAIFGKLGNGPNEFMNPRFSSIANLGIRQNQLLIPDSKHIYSLHLDSLTKGYSAGNKLKTVVDIPMEVSTYSSIVQYNQNKMVINIHGEQQLSIIDIPTHYLQEKSYHKQYKRTKAKGYPFNLNLYQAFYSSRGNDTVAITYKNFKQVDIVSIKTGHLTSIRFPNYDENISTIRRLSAANNEPNTTIFYTFAASTKKGVFALCWDMPKYDTDNKSNHPEIHHFGWDGKLMARYKIDRPISSFFISEDSGDIYAIGINDSHTKGLYKLRISKITSEH